MAEIKEIEKNIKTLKAEVIKTEKKGRETEQRVAFRTLKKKLRRAQRRRRVLLSFQKHLEDRKGKASEKAE